MVCSLLLALQWQLQSPFIKAAVNGTNYWTQSVEEWAQPSDYHPQLRFYRESSFMFVTPDFVMQGKYQVQNGHYAFKAVTAFELENSDVAHLKEDMDPQAALKFAQAYARSMQDFPGDYNQTTDILYVTYLWHGMKRTFQLHSFTEGDPEGKGGIIGLWQGPEPHPERLDSRTRYKIGGLEGLQRFLHEAEESDGSQFSVVDFRSDGSYRSGALIGTWTMDGRTVTMRGKGTTLELTLNDKGELTAGGKPALVRY